MQSMRATCPLCLTLLLDMAFNNLYLLYSLYNIIQYNFKLIIFCVVSFSSIFFLLRAVMLKLCWDYIIYFLRCYIRIFRGLFFIFIDHFIQKANPNFSACQGIKIGSLCHFPHLLLAVQPLSQLEDATPALKIAIWQKKS